MLKVSNLTKMYDGKPLLRGVSFSIAAGETICLLGASGSGKSTILRIIAGLEVPESGEIFWQGKNLSGVPVHKRNFGLMFQDYALFPHLDVFDNIAFGLKMQNWSKGQIENRVVEVLGQTNLGAFSHRKVIELSGGEQQRVALARAIAPNPGLLMLDEPLGALDRALRESLITELRDILHRSGIPAIYVTHDQQEAFTIADTIILLHEGCVEQAGSPPDVISSPVSAWVAGFLGLGNLLEGIVGAGFKPAPTSQVVKTSAGLIPLVVNLPEGSAVTLLLRPQALVVDSGETLTGKVIDVVFRGQDFRVELDTGLYFYLEFPPNIGDVLKLKVSKVELL